MYEKNNFHEDLLDQLEEGICYFDNNLKIQYCNKEVENLTGVHKGEFIGRQFWARDAVRPGTMRMTNKHSVLKEVQNGHDIVLDENLQMENGTVRPVQIKMIPFKDQEGEIIGAIEVIRDNSDIKEFELKIEELERLAFYDSLTLLSNRRQIEQQLSVLLHDKQRYGWSFGIIFFDIDQFKDINDTYGHPAGDKVLNTIASITKSTFRASDIIGRWGGDEFIVLVKCIDDDILHPVAEKFRRIVESFPVNVDNNEIPMTVSIGATLGHEKDTLESLMERVDKLLYNSKKEGRNLVTTG